MGVAGWRFAHVKRNLNGRATIVAVLEDWQVICSAVVAAGAIIMLGIMLYRIGRSKRKATAAGRARPHDLDQRRPARLPPTIAHGI